MCLLLCQYHAFLINVALEYSLNRERDTSTYFFFLQSALAIESFVVPKKFFRIILSYFCESVLGILIVIALNL